jgi:nicotinate-nucleotide pyrophosphorylase (carboxylating)
MSSAPPPPAETIAEDVRRALDEDLGSGDVTSDVVPSQSHARARVIAREPAVQCGSPWFDRVFAVLDTRIETRWSTEDGAMVATGQTLCTLTGPARGILSGERTALNFLQLLSGVATRSRSYADIVAHSHTQVLDSRKTLPGLRAAQKYAVRCGGCTNHRMGLYDGFLIKENHLLAAGSISKAITQARATHPQLPVEVEVENVDQLEEALDAGADTVMLDNFDRGAIREAVDIAAGRAKLEVSGNMDLRSVAELANLGVDFISVGALTKNVSAIDLSMRFLDSEPGD